jgi:tetratricopeptide (TPR) repeat protein
VANEGGKMKLGRIVKSGFLVMAFFFAFNSVFGSDNHLLEQGKELFLEGRQMFYNAEKPIPEAIATLNEGKELLLTATDSFGKYYWLAQVELLLGEVKEVANEEKEAARCFSNTEELINKAIDFDPNRSDAYRILADAYVRLMPYKSMFYAMSHGSKANNLYKKALDLDDKNYAAYNAMGVYCLHAPAIGGGGVDKAIENLEKALESNDRHENFISYIWLGTAYEKKKMPGEAEAYLEKALEIYPNSQWAQSVLNRIKEKN